MGATPSTSTTRLALERRRRRRNAAAAAKSDDARLKKKYICAVHAHAQTHTQLLQHILELLLLLFVHRFILLLARARAFRLRPPTIHLLQTCRATHTHHAAHGRPRLPAGDRAADPAGVLLGSQVRRGGGGAPWQKRAHCFSSARTPAGGRRLCGIAAPQRNANWCRSCVVDASSAQPACLCSLRARMAYMARSFAGFFAKKTTAGCSTRRAPGSRARMARAMSTSTSAPSSASCRRCVVFWGVRGGAC